MSLRDQSVPLPRAKQMERTKSLGRRTRFRFYLLVAAVALPGLSACSPSLVPLYRDFEAGVSPDSGATSDTATNPGTPSTPVETLEARIERAVLAAGWELSDAPASNVTATQARVVRRWGLYHTEVSIEVSPVNRNYVRVLVHPYRVYFTGHRSKMPFLKRSIRKAVFDDLQRTFEDEGIHDVGYAFERDGLADR